MFHSKLEFPAWFIRNTITLVHMFNQATSSIFDDSTNSETPEYSQVKIFTFGTKVVNTWLQFTTQAMAWCVLDHELYTELIIPSPFQ